MTRILGGLFVVAVGGLHIETSPMLGALVGVFGVVMILSGALASLAWTR